MNILSIRNKVLTYFPFVKTDESTLVCKLSSGDILKFRFFKNAVDLIINERTLRGYEERTLVCSFSFDNKEDVELLKEMTKEAECKKSDE